MAHRNIKVDFELQLPADASVEEIDTWLKYHLGAIGHISEDNPLVDYDLEAHGLFINWRTR